MSKCAYQRAFSKSKNAENDRIVHEHGQRSHKTTQCGKRLTTMRSHRARRSRITQPPQEMGQKKVRTARPNTKNTLCFIPFASSTRARVRQGPEHQARTVQRPYILKSRRGGKPCGLWDFSRACSCSRTARRRCDRQSGWVACMSHRMQECADSESFCASSLLLADRS